MSLLAALHSSACGAAAFACDGDGSCGDGGRCESNGYCSFADDACASGRRFGEHAPSGIAGGCVDLGASTDDGSTSLAADGGGSSSGAATTATTTLTGTTLTSDADSGGVTTSAGTSSGDGGETSSGGPTPIDVGPIPIATDLDDGAMWPAVPGEMGSWLPSGEMAVGLSYLGEYPAGEPYWGYFRFQLPRALPIGTVVLGAVLTIDGHAVYQWDPQTAALRVWAESSHDAPQVEGLASLPGEGLVTLTDASARWPAMGGLIWSIDGSNPSPDLSPLLQELVDAGGLLAGGSVQFWVAADALGTGGREVGWIDAAAADDREATLQLSLLLP